MRILVIDKDPRVAASVERMVVMAGHFVNTAANLREARRILMGSLIPWDVISFGNLDASEGGSGSGDVLTLVDDAGDAENCRMIAATSDAPVNDQLLAAGCAYHCDNKAGLAGMIRKLVSYAGPATARRG